MSNQKCSRCGEDMKFNEAFDTWSCPLCSTRKVIAAPVAGMPMRRRTWLWSDRVPLGEITIWAGHAGIGKSQAAVWLASQVTRGTLPGELEGTPTSVLYFGSEDSWEFTLGPRFMAAGADLERVFRLYVADLQGETVVSLSRDLEGVAAQVEATGARLVVLDALLSTMTGRNLGEQGSVRALLQPLSDFAQKLNIAVVGVAHFRKSGGAEPLHMISGSAEFGQVVRSSIGFARDPNAEDRSAVMSNIKSNISPEDVPSLRYRVVPAVVDTPEGPTDVGRFEILGETDADVRNLVNETPTTEGERSELSEAAQWLVAHLKDHDGAAPRKDILAAAKDAGYSLATLNRAKVAAGVQHISEGFPRSTFWRLPVISGANETTGDETTETTGLDLRKHPPESAPKRQSSQAHERETTGVNEPSTAHMWWPRENRGEHGRDCPGCRRAPGGPDHTNERTTP